MGGGGGGGGGNFRDGDWMCSACGNHNFASRANCNKCGAPKAATAGMMMQMPTAAAAGSGGGGGGGRQMRPGDWMCSECGNHNFASREACNKCGVPKPEGAGAGGAGAGDGMQVQGSYGAAAPIRPSTASSPYSKPAAAAGGEREMKEGDWTCTQCGNHNFASRVNCNKCGAVREGFREGDWICKACRNHNFAKNMTCKKCGAPRSDGKGQHMMMGNQQMMMAQMMGQGMNPMMAQMGGMGGMGGMMGGAAMGKNMKEGDWFCSSCGNHNFASRTSCNKCQAVRPGFKQGDWICKSCKNHNFASRDACNKCGAPKE